MSLGPPTQVDQEFYHSSQRMVSPLPYQVGGGGYMYSTLISPTVGMTLPQSPVHAIQLQPSEVCPKDFIIFDQTDERNRVMFHPVLTQNFNCPFVDRHSMVFQGNAVEINNDAEDAESISSMKEDTDDIDALLSSEEHDDDDDDDDDVSTARTLGCYSPDSCSSYSLKSQKIKLSSEKSSSDHNSFGSTGSSNECQRQRMRKMVKVLRGIVPGAADMSTAAVLDEAVRYLKSLKVEVKKLGIGNFNK